MAIMVNFATDWTFDMFLEDCKSYKALPIKGVRCPKGASDRERFIASVKLHCNEFVEANKQAFTNEHGILLRYELGEALKQSLDRSLYFSDYYKDVYNQRPHLDRDLYLTALGFGDLVNRMLWTGLSFKTMEDILDGYASSAEKTRENGLD